MTASGQPPTVNRHVSKDLRKPVKAALDVGWRLEFCTGGHAQRCQLVSPDGVTVIQLSGAGGHSGGPGQKHTVARIRRALETG